jgi:PAS domain S-box-containing protein
MQTEELRIIIINDYPDDVELLKKHLGECSLPITQYIEAATGEEGIRACLEQPLRRNVCAIVDLHLPDMSGLDVVKGLKDSEGESFLPMVLFIDTGAQCKAASEAVRAGAQDYIAKSWLTTDGLSCAIENAIERYKLQERLGLKRAALGRSEREFKTLVENIPDIIASFDTELRHLYVNPAIEQATGVPPEAFVGKTLAEAGVPASYREVWEAKLRDALESKANIRFEFESPSPFGSGWYHSQLVPNTTPKGDVVSILGVSTDITKLKQAEQRLREADRRKNEFLAMLAHEIRNPLAAIRTAAHVLHLKGPVNSEVDWARGVIDRQVSMLTRLIDDLLDVSRVTMGKVELKRVPTDIREVIDRACEAVRPLMESRAHTLEIRVPPTPLPALVDPARIEQVIGNLLANAAKYTENGGSICLTATLEGPSIMIAVRDNGIGVSAAMLPYIFDLFTQADSRFDRAQEGLGVGLTIVKSLVEMHGGSVAVTSDGPGTGSTFTIKLPARLESSSALTPAQGLSPSLQSERRPLRILIVDDNVDVADGLARLVSTDGHVVRTAHDAATALTIAQVFHPELVFTDLGLPGMNGYDLARAFRQHETLRSATLVAISGYGQEEHRENSREAGFDDHLLKPVEMESLSLILARFYHGAE